MAISTPTVLASGEPTMVGAQSITTSSVAPAATRLLILTVHCAASSGTPIVGTPTVSGLGLTWNYEGRGTENVAATPVVGDFPRQGWMWTAVTGASPASGTITVTLQAAVGQHMWYTLTQFAAGEVELSDPIIRPSARFPSLPPDNGVQAPKCHHEMASLAAPGNAVYHSILIGNTITAAQVTTSPGCTRLAYVQPSGQWAQLTEFSPNETLLFNNDWTASGLISHYVSIGCEIRAAGNTGSGRVRDRLLSTGSSTVDGTTFTSGTFTTYKDRDIWLAVSSARAGATPSQPTITDSVGLTWTLVTSVGYSTVASPTQKLWLFRARTGGTDPTPAMTVTATYPETQTAAAYIIDETRYSHASSPVWQIATNSVDNGGASGLTATFSSTRATSGILAFVAKKDVDRASGADTLTGTVESGYVLHEQSAANDTIPVAVFSFGRHTPESTPSVALRQNADAAIIAIEVREENTAPLPTGPALVFLDGFELGGVGQSPHTGATRYYDTVQNATTTASVFKHGAASLVCSPTLSAGGYVRKNLAAGQRTLTLSFYLRIASPLPAADLQLATIGNATASASLFYLASTQTLAVRWGSSAFQATFGQVLAPDLWYQVDWKIDTTASLYTQTCRMEKGTPGVATRSLVADDLTYVQLGSASVTGPATTLYYDDLVVSYTIADYPIGPPRVEPLAPNGDGTHNAGVNIMEDQAGADIGTVPAYPLLSGIDATSFVRQNAVGATNYAEVTFPTPTDTTQLWGVEAYQVSLSSGSTANSATSRVVDASGATLVNIFSGDMSDTDLRYTSVIVPAPLGGWTQALIDDLKVRVGFAITVPGASKPEWTTIALAYATSGAGAVAMSGTATGTSSATGRMQATKPLHGSAVVELSGGYADVFQDIYGGEVAAHLGLRPELIGAATASSAGTGNVSREIRLIATAGGTSSGEAEFAATGAGRRLQGVADGSADTDGNLSRDRGLSGEAGGLSSGLGRLRFPNESVILPPDTTYMTIIATPRLIVTTTSVPRLTAGGTP